MEVGSLVRGLEGLFRATILCTTVIGRALAVIKLILFPSDLNPSSGQDVLHGGAIELGEILVEHTIRKKSLPEGINYGFLVTKMEWRPFIY